MHIMRTQPNVLKRIENLLFGIPFHEVLRINHATSMLKMRCKLELAVLHQTRNLNVTVIETGCQLRLDICKMELLSGLKCPVSKLNFPPFASRFENSCQRYLWALTACNFRASGPKEAHSTSLERSQPQ